MHQVESRMDLTETTLEVDLMRTHNCGLGMANAMIEYIRECKYGMLPVTTAVGLTPYEADCQSWFRKGTATALPAGASTRKGIRPIPSEEVVAQTEGKEIGARTQTEGSEPRGARRLTFVER